MAGPYPPHQGTDAFGPAPVAGPSAEYPAAGYPYPEPYHAPPTGPIMPAIPYPEHRRGRKLLVSLAILGVLAALAVGAVFAARSAAPAAGGVAITEDSARTAIQGYLDALSKGDLQEISRNALCGLYDGVQDRRADDQLAKLSSDAFQKQFSKADVVSVDTIVPNSAEMAQVLFTMQTAPGAGSRGSGPVQRQAVAQLLAFDGRVLVCSYVMRTAGVF